VHARVSVYEAAHRLITKNTMTVIMAAAAMAHTKVNPRLRS